MISGASLFFVSTVVMSLFSPLGRVLYHAGPLLITEDALNEGLQKGLNMAGLLYLSRFSVRAELRLPGKFGQLISRMFFYLHYLIEERKKIKLGSLTSTLDALFIKVGERSFKDFTITEVHSPGTTPGGLLFILLTISFNWVLLF